MQRLSARVIRLALLAAGLLGLPRGAAALDAALIAEDNKILAQISDAFRSSFGGSVEAFPFDPGSPNAAIEKAKAKSPKVFVVLGSGPAKAAKEAAGDASILYAGVVQPSKLGLEGAKNVGGVPMTVPVKQQWAMAMKGVRMRRVTAIMSSDNADKRAEAEAAGKALGIKVSVEGVSGDLSAALGKVGPDDTDAVWIPLDPAVAQQVAFKAIVEVCVRKKLPLLVPTASYVKQGGIMSISLGYPEMGKRLAKIARGVVGGQAAGAAAAASSEGDEEITVNLPVAKEIGQPFSADFLKTVTSKVE